MIPMGKKTEKEGFKVFSDADIAPFRSNKHDEMEGASSGEGKNPSPNEDTGVKLFSGGNVVSPFDPKLKGKRKALA